MSKKSIYKALLASVCDVINEESNETAVMATVSSLIYDLLPDLNWAGFYLLELPSPDADLVVGPYQGRPACIRIKSKCGVCGAAVARERVVRVENVHEFPGHIACDGASKSEIVLPIYDKKRRTVGVLDIDSPIFNRFDDIDEEWLTKIAAALTVEFR